MEVVCIKKILVQNLLIYIYLHCVRRSSWTITILATLTDRHLCFRKQKVYLSKSRSRENGVCAMAIPVMEFQVRTWYKFSWAFFLNMNLFKGKFSIFKNKILASSQKKRIFIFNIWFWHIFSLVKIWSFFLKWFNFWQKSIGFRIPGLETQQSVLLLLLLAYSKYNPPNPQTN